MMMTKMSHVEMELILIDPITTNCDDLSQEFEKERKIFHIQRLNKKPKYKLRRK